MMVKSIDINCDMGESFGRYTIGNDDAIIEFISSANVACGFHAGDPLVMEKTVSLCISKKVAVGAHASYPDLMGFGRRKMETFPGEIKNYLIYQMGAIEGFLRSKGERLHHLKPHGALYNQAANEENVAREVISAVKEYNPDLPLFCLANSPLVKWAKEEGLVVVSEFFPDRGYLSDGTLCPRSRPGALIKNPEEVKQRVELFLTKGEVITVDGTNIQLEAETMCVHGDSSTALELARAIREVVESLGIEIRPF